MDQPQIITSAPVKPSKKKIIAASIVGILIGIWIVFSVLVELEAFPQKETFILKVMSSDYFPSKLEVSFSRRPNSAFARSHVAGWAVDKLPLALHLTDFYSYDMYIFS